MREGKGVLFSVFVFGSSAPLSPWLIRPKGRSGLSMASSIFREASDFPVLLVFESLHLALTGLP